MISTETDQSMQSQIKDKPVGTKRDVLISYATIPGEVVLRRMTKSQFVELAFDQIDDLLNDIFCQKFVESLAESVKFYTNFAFLPQAFFIANPTV